MELGLLFLGDSRDTWVTGGTLGCRQDSVIQAESAHGSGWHTKGHWVTGGKGDGEEKKKSLASVVPAQRVSGE